MMFSEELIEELRKAREKYEKEIGEILKRTPGAEKEYITFSGTPVKPLYSPEDNREIDFSREISFPGQYPYTRGVFPAGYRSRGLHIRQVTGFGTAEETNRRWKFLLSKGANALSFVCDDGSGCRADSDDPRVRGMVGAGDLAYPLFVTQKPIIIGSIYISPIYIGTLALTALLFGIFGFFFKHSTQGVAMRAVADDQMASQSLGVSVKRVFGVSWAIAALVATIGGIIIALVNGLNAQSLSFVGLKVFPVVILGGLDSIVGAIIGGVIIGILENLAIGYLDPLVGGGLGETFPFFVLIVLLMIKPYGLFGIVEIERV